MSFTIWFHKLSLPFGSRRNNVETHEKIAVTPGKYIVSKYMYLTDKMQHKTTHLIIFINLL